MDFRRLLLFAIPMAAEAQTAREILDEVDQLMRGESSRGVVSMEITTEHWARELEMEVHDVPSRDDSKSAPVSPPPRVERRSTSGESQLRSSTSITRPASSAIGECSTKSRYSGMSRHTWES